MFKNFDAEQLSVMDLNFSDVQKKTAKYRNALSTIINTTQQRNPEVFFEKQISKLEKAAKSGVDYVFFHVRETDLMLSLKEAVEKRNPSFFVTSLFVNRSATETFQNIGDNAVNKLSLEEVEEKYDLLIENKGSLKDLEKKAAILRCLYENIRVKIVTPAVYPSQLRFVEGMGI